MIHISFSYMLMEEVSWNRNSCSLEHTFMFHYTATDKIIETYLKSFISKRVTLIYIYTKTTMKLHVITYNKNAFKSNLPTLYILTLPTQIDFILIAAVLWYAHKKILIVQEIMAHTMKLMALDLNCIMKNTFKKYYIIEIAK